VMGGLFLSTILSLVFIPSVYTIMDDLSHLVARLFHHALAPNEVDEDTGDERHGPPAPALHSEMRIAAE
jgi:hypothetical protein